MLFVQVSNVSRALTGAGAGADAGKSHCDFRKEYLGWSMGVGTGATRIQLCLNLKDPLFPLSNTKRRRANRSPKATVAKLLCSFQLVELGRVTVVLDSSSHLFFLVNQSPTPLSLLIMFACLLKTRSLRIVFLCFAFQSMSTGAQVRNSDLYGSIK